MEKSRKNKNVFGGEGKDKRYRVTLCLVAIIAITISLFTLYTSLFGSLLAHKQRMIHLFAEMAIAYLLYQCNGKQREQGVSYLGVIITVFLLSTLIYTFINYDTMIYRIGNPTTVDIIIGIILMILVLEGTRRTVGWPLVVITLVFISYCFLGPHLNGILAHRGISVSRLSDLMYMSNEGIFGSPLGASASSIAIFVIFGAFLEVTHAGDIFIDLAVAATGKSAGGPAKAAVVGSALMGTISGSSIANVVGTGTFTIPLMKKAGYHSEFAGAVEAASSTGGQLMPPVMGAAAFLMVDYTGLPYKDIMIAAIFPAVIYFLGVYIAVHLEAKKKGLKGVDAIPDVKMLLRYKGHLLLPLFVIIGLLTKGTTPMKTAVWAIILLIVLAMLGKSTRIGLGDMLAALKKAGESLVPVAMACACAGIVSGIISLTGVGLKIASFIEYLAHGSLFTALVLTMVTCIILGMGLPTVATYVVLITIVGPVLTRMGVPVLAAHLFVFYFGVVADITPPVALAAYAASGISGGNTFKTGLWATGIAAGGFIVPYVFAFAPDMLLDVSNGFLSGMIAALPVFITAFLGVTMLSACVIGYLFLPVKIYEFVILLIGAIMLIIPGTITDIVGIILLAAVILSQLVIRKDELKARKEKA